METEPNTEQLKKDCEKELLPQNGDKKPIVLSSERYNKILKNSEDSSTTQLNINKANEEYRQYLKDGSDELVKKFQGNLKRTQEQKLEELKAAAMKKDESANVMIEQAKEQATKERHEKITNAYLLLEKAKPGPRELRSAALQSEILRARDIQMTINEEYAKVLQENAEKPCDEGTWIKDGQERIAEREQANNLYKKELLQTIQEREKIRKDQKQQKLEAEQEALKLLKKEAEERIEYERASLEKKRLTHRRNAIEAMRMAEQRRQREEMADDVENRLCCVYNVGKRELDKRRAQQTQKLNAEYLIKIEANAKYAEALHVNLQEIEEERYRRDVSRNELKFTAEEREKVCRHRAAKKARIESYLREMEQKKKAQRIADEEKRFEMAQRFKNEDVNAAFEENKKMEKKKNAEALRKQLNEQVVDTKERENKQQEIDQRDCITANHMAEDKFFLDYAQKLIHDAKQNERPLYPLIRAVKQYTTRNEIQCTRRLPKHMQSHLQIGCGPPVGPKVTAAYTARKNAAANANNTDQAQILEKCLQINEIIGDTEQYTKPKVCDHNCPVECAHNAPNMKRNGTGDAGLPDSPKIRYSILQLRSLNQYAAPSLY